MSKAILTEALALIALSPLIFLYGWPGALALLAAVGLLMIRNVQREQSGPGAVVGDGGGSADEQHKSRSGQGGGPEQPEPEAQV